ncbi:MAG: DNA polymerase/3'-5' exonuclease PolX [bacterium]|nr:DNA polymerase/3'-5' exonuclease PolX [bacterium]
MKNYLISQMFEKMADSLEFQGENPFKVNAYRRAARVIVSLTEDIENIWKMGNLREVPGVGEGIAKKIDEFLKTGRMNKYEEALSEVPDTLIKLMKIQGLGPKTLFLINKELGVKDLEDLKKVISDGSLANLPSMGEQKVNNIKRGIEWFLHSKDKILLGKAYHLVERIIEELKKRVDIEDITPAGSLRRMNETVGDIDILATGNNPKKIIEEFTSLSNIAQVIACGNTKGSIITKEGVQVDLRIVDRSSFGAALQYFTGSKSHNIKMRTIAKERGLKINEYGVFKDEEKIAGKTEYEVYQSLNMKWIPPELREDRGEIELYLEGQSIEIIQQNNILGDLHIHSVWSDGVFTIEEIALKAKEYGYKYVAICDHSQSVKYAGGLTEKEIVRQIEEIREINAKIPGIEILAGSEVDIKSNGNLDFSDKILEKLDIVIAAIHTGFKQNVTQRIITAMENPLVNVIAHPTGRLISSREGYEVDIAKVIEKAANTKTFLEINSYFDRLDLNDINCRKAKEFGAKFTLGTDAHHIDQFWTMKLGVGVARRGWLSKEDILNTYEIEDLMKYLKIKRQ